MTLRYPELVALAPLLALVFVLALVGRWQRVQRVVRAYDSPALRRLLPSATDRFPRGRLVCLAVAGIALGLAAAEPVWVGSDEPAPPLDLALVMDLSLSMGATDVAPTRIARARTVVDRLVEELPSARFSLVTFAGWPFALVPPTDDPALVRYFADSLRVELVREQDRGSSLWEALDLTRETLELRARPDGRRLALVLSDGSVPYVSDVESLAADLAEGGVEIWTAGIGTREGAALFAGSEQVLDAGSPVVATLNADVLRAVADAGRGRYVDVSDEAGLESLVDDLRDASGDAGEGAPPPIDATFLLTLLAVPLLLWEGAADAKRRTEVRSSTEVAP